ncbi:hypothetical protein SAMN04487996_102306 [Dyadobacter soli]|uniref:Uncharacterized protein n=1 Tax=Dyadobacter soli TaxID=659014 RepID=A0A1G6XZF1_9BACT|nr:HEPN domain-containing protein [Dyadobacter soli]SDD83604.1 hypothetical protein SAMN04487996_102306 [Dyadobacter soli]
MATIFPIKGYWFLPSNENHKVAGILDIDHDVFRLELFGSLRGSSQEVFFDSIEWDKSTVIPLILGHGSDGKDYSLMGCISGASSLNFNADLPLTSYLIDHVLQGCQLDERDEKIFKKLRIEYSHLQDWLGFTGFSPDNFDKSGFSFIYQYPDSISVNIDNTFLLKFGYQYSYNGSSRYDRKIVQTCFLDIETQTDLSYLDLCKPMRLFQDFLSLATLSTVSVKSTTLFWESDTGGSHDEFPIKLELFLSPESVEMTKEKPFSKFLFQHDDIKEVLQEILSRWFLLNAEMLPIRRYLIESVKRKKVFEINNFLNIVQALEGFHSRFRNEERAFKASIGNLIQEFKIIDLVKTEFEDEGSIIESTKDSRHYYSHFYRLRNDSTKQGRELFYLTKKLRILLICCVLKEVGFDDALTNSVVKSDKL